MTTTSVRRLARASVLALLAAILLPARPARAQDAMTLQEAIAIAQRQGHQARAALYTREAGFARDRAFGAGLLPQVSLAGNLPVYNRSIIPVLQPDGSTLFRSQQQHDMSLTMNVTQQLPFTGGELFVSSALARLEVTGERETRSWSSTPFQVGIRQSLLRPNTAGWNSREQHLRSAVIDRQYVEAREDVAIATVTAFFDYFAARVTLANATTNSIFNDSLFVLNQGRFEVGKIGENELLQSELQLLRSRTTLDGARLEHDRTLAALRLQLNLPIGSALDVAAPSRVPDIRADTALAVAQALRNRAQPRELELQDVQAQRRVNEARLNSGVGATVQASMGFNQSGGEMDAVYRDLLEAQRVSVSVQMPLVRWGGRSAEIQAARSDLARTQVLAQQTREQLVQEAHFAALQAEQSRRQFDLSAKADTVAAKGFEVARNRYSIGKIDLNALLIAQNAKDQALTAYVTSMRGYWLAYYRLRRATLYDFEAGDSIR